MASVDKIGDIVVCFLNKNKDFKSKQNISNQDVNNKALCLCFDIEGIKLFIGYQSGQIILWEKREKTGLFV